MPKLAPLPDRVLIHTSKTERRVLDPADVYWIDADGHDTWLRLRGRRRIRDVRPLAELETLFAPHGFVRVHHDHIVNARRILRLRKREDARDWELRLEPPVNRVLPISRGYLDDLRAVFGEG